MPNVYEQERELTGEVADTIGRRLPEVEVLAVELVSPTRFCVYVDHPNGVDHALCGRVTDVLRGYLDRYSVDVSSPGHRAAAAQAGALPRRGRPHGRAPHRGAIDGRTRFRGRSSRRRRRGARLEVDGAEARDIPYDAIVRGNLIDEGYAE